MTVTPHTGFQKFEIPRRSHSAGTLSAASVVCGAGLAAFGVSRKSWPGAALAAAGAYLVYNGVSGVAKPYSGKVRVGYTIGKAPEEVYKFVRDAANWSRFTQGLEMESTGTDSLKLTFGKPAGFSVVSEANITGEEAGKFIAWNSGGEPLQHRGVIHFKAAPGERGTEISVALEFTAPAGQVARAVASFVGWDPEQLVRESLRHLKELLEAGEVPSTKGQPVGARGFKGAALRVLYREAPAEDASKTRLAGD